MPVFHGDKYDEDPEEFLIWFHECTRSGDDAFKARNFVNYLQADSIADEWFEELSDEEKRSWATIEVLFRKEWLNIRKMSSSSLASLMSLRRHQRCQRPKDVTSLQREVHVFQRRWSSLKDDFCLSKMCVCLCKAHLWHLCFA
jgi:hypothetical protein